MTFLALAGAAVLGAVGPTLLWIHERATNSSKSSASQTVFKAAESVSAIAAGAASRSAQDWHLAAKVQEAVETCRSLKSEQEKLLATADRMDLTIGKIAEWTVLNKGRGAPPSRREAREVLESPSEMPSIALGVRIPSAADESGIAQRVRS